MPGTWDTNISQASSNKQSPGGTDEYTPCGSFIVTVQDNGVGVAAENLNAVFSDGWQFKANMLQVGYLNSIDCFVLPLCCMYVCMRCLISYLMLVMVMMLLVLHDV
jgi:hypothetical protein